MCAQYARANFGIKHLSYIKDRLSIVNEGRMYAREARTLKSGAEQA